MITADRYHDISVGHRVHGHESKCANLHGHNYRVHFSVTAAALDTVGRVLDFSVIKSRLCMWLEENWDHKFLAWTDDLVMRELMPACEPGPKCSPMWRVMNDSIVWVPFNPTAENIAEHLVRIVGPRELQGTGCKLISVKIEETRKCSVQYTKETQ